MPQLLWLACLAGVWLGGRPALAQQGELERFETARGAYDRGDYTRSAAQFAELVEGPAPRLQSRPLVLESRKFLAASYLFLGRDADAQRQFLALLRQDPDYRLDPVAFPASFYLVFERARQQLEAEAQREKPAAPAPVPAPVAVVAPAPSSAPAAVVAERANSRWVAAIPFGVGQFQNGHARLGIALAITEGLFAALSITTFALHESLRNEQPLDADIDRANRSERAFRYSNWIATGLFAATAIGGIVDAQVRFVPSTRRRAPAGSSAQRQLGLAVSPLGVLLHGRF